MSGNSLNDLISTVFLRAANPPPPQDFDPRNSNSSRAASSSASSSSTSTVDPAEQTLALLNRAQNISDSIGVISANDALRDISTSSLRTLLLPSLAAELHLAVRTGTDRIARQSRLRQSQLASAKFLSRTLALGVVPPSTHQLLRWTCASIPDAELVELGLDANALSSTAEAGAGGVPHVREVKIAMFKLERALKANLEQFRQAYSMKSKKVVDQSKVADDVTYDLLLYPRAARDGADDQDDDDNDDDDDGGNETSSASAPGGIANVRQYLLALLNLHALRNAQSLASTSQELELLRSMPPASPPTSTTASTQAQGGEGDEWRLDRSQGSTLRTTGPLMAPTGKVLRPFTITNRTRDEINASVFRPGYRLPTMSIDEYLEEEQRRGNIIQGGGQASYDKPTSTEQRQSRAEEDGTKDAEEAEEEQRQKDIHWDTFTEENRRGAGNTMNRG